MQALLEADLVDELRLMVFPIILGSGKRLFADESALRAFALAESGQAGDTVTLVYRRAPEA